MEAARETAAVTPDTGSRPKRSFLRSTKIAAVVLLLVAGTLCNLAGLVPVGTACTIAGGHLAVGEGLERFQNSRLAKRLSLSTLKSKTMRHVGGLAFSVILATAGVLLSLGPLYPIGVPFLVTGAELAVQAVGALRKDIEIRAGMKAEAGKRPQPHLPGRDVGERPTRVGVGCQECL